MKFDASRDRKARKYHARSRLALAAWLAISGRPRSRLMQWSNFIGTLRHRTSTSYLCHRTGPRNDDSHIQRISSHDVSDGACRSVSGTAAIDRVTSAACRPPQCVSYMQTSARSYSTGAVSRLQHASSPYLAIGQTAHRAT
jgi:hypothetical protein